MERYIYEKNLNLDLESDKDIIIDLEFVKKANQDINFKPDLKKKRSIAGYIQISIDYSKDSNEKLIVVNSLFSGYGKMYSRFLHLFPKSVTRKLKENNIRIQPKNSVFAELQDSSFHNANLHPNLLDYEIRIPGGHKSLAGDKQILLSDINVLINRSEKSLKLIHNKTGKIIYPFDLGFQGSAGRSELFKLMNVFTYADFNSPISLVNYISNKIYKHKGARNVIILPRIMYGNDICFQRKTWIISKKCVPIRKVDEDEVSYFFRITEWKNTFLIPDHFFVRLVVRSVQINFEYPKSVGKDDYKPQFVNLNSLLLVILFENLIIKSR
ncbi:lantibiotic dehydratase [Pedobacter sp. NJ-S-72]